MQKETKYFYEFGSFRLDPIERLLFQHGALVPLAPKVMELLLLLVQQSGHILEKDVLMKAVWPDTFVEEYSLTRNVSILRKSLGETGADQAYIETIPKRGYRFIAEVRQVPEESGAASTGVFTDLLSAPPDVCSEKIPEATADILMPPNVAPPAPILSGREAARGRRHLEPRSWLGPVGVTVLLVMSSIVIAQLWLASRSQSAELVPLGQTMAILPFKSIGDERMEDYLAVGMADSLITRLSNIRQVVVRPTSAVLKYNRSDQDPVAAGRALGVESVLTGCFRKSGDRVRVTVQVINVKDGIPLWADKFDERITDLFSLEDAISERVAHALMVRLTGNEKALLTRRSTSNVEAYQAYLKGRFFWSQRTPEGLQKSIDYFKEAISKDANYALAYVGLADGYSQSSYYSLMPARQSLSLAETAARQALALDSTLAEAHTSLAYIKEHSWDWATAEEEYKRASALNPNYVIVHHWYSLLLAKQGRFPEAVSIARLAQDLDPVSPVISMGLARIYYWQGNYDLALEQCRKVIDLHPGFATAHRYLGLVLLQKGELDEATAALKRSLSLSKRDGHALAVLGYIHGRAGRLAEAQQILMELESRSRQNFVSPYSMAIAYLGANKQAKALEFLSEAYHRRSAWLSLLRVDPLMNQLRADERFTHIVQQVGLPS